MKSLIYSNQNEGQGKQESSKQAPLQLAKSLEGPGQNLGEPIHRKGRKEHNKSSKQAPLAQWYPDRPDTVQDDGTELLPEKLVIFFIHEFCKTESIQ